MILHLKNNLKIFCKKSRQTYIVKLVESKKKRREHRWNLKIYNVLNVNIPFREISEHDTDVKKYIYNYDKWINEEVNGQFMTIV